MSFDWADFLTLAEALVSNPNSPGPVEAALRSAISRAYYAAFQCALNFARKENFIPSYSGDDHLKVRDHFRDYQPVDSIRRKIALELDRTRDNRRQADYDAVLTSPDSLAYNTISMAKSVLNKLESLADSN